MNKFDYIIVGGGCAGLSLAVAIVQEASLSDKSILIVEPEEKNSNDRTWCFWEQNPGRFESIVFKRWDQLQVFGSGLLIRDYIAPYTYKMIRGIEFYKYCRAILSHSPQVKFIRARASGITNTRGLAQCLINDELFYAEYIFNSLFDKRVVENRGTISLWQHFKGYYIRTNEARFDAGVATLMDFDIPQTDTSFVYVLPLNDREALVEFTVFGETLLPAEAYDLHLNSYLTNKLQLTNPCILEQEYGVIPMSDYPFSAGENRVINIGTAGGHTKGSSGYTFQFIQKHTTGIVNALKAGRSPIKTKGLLARRFKFYDDLLLAVLREKPGGGAALFCRLFKKNKMRDVLAFLANESTLPAECALISSLPAKPFLYALAQKWF